MKFLTHRILLKKYLITDLGFFLLLTVLLLFEPRSEHSSTNDWVTSFHYHSLQSFALMKQTARLLLLKKYAFIDVGILLLLVALPLYVNPENIIATIRRAILYSGFITPLLSLYEIKRNNLSPYFDNLRVSPVLIYSSFLILKIFIAILIGLYV